MSKLPSTILDTPCLEYQGLRSKKGYGRKRFPTYKREDGSIARPETTIHRWVYQEAFGPLSKDRVVMHRCDNPPCFRLDHLQEGSHQDNERDKRTKGRQPIFKHFNPSAKLNPEKVAQIRKLLTEGLLQRDIAKIFGVTDTAISNIKLGKTYSDTGGPLE